MLFYSVLARVSITRHIAPCFGDIETAAALINLEFASMRMANGKLGRWSAMKNRWQSDCGQGLVEMAMVLLLFLLLIFAISDFSILFYVYQSMEHGISEATRYGITGQQMPDPNDPSSFLSREESIKLVMCKSNPIIDLDDSSFTFEHLSEAVWIAGYGGPGDISRVTVKYNWSPVTPLIKSLFKDGQIPLQASSTVKNESFPTP